MKDLNSGKRKVPEGLRPSDVKEQEGIDDITHFPDFQHLLAVPKDPEEVERLKLVSRHSE